MKKLSICRIRNDGFYNAFLGTSRQEKRFLLTKNDPKNHFFFAFSAIFRDFWKIEKNSQVQNFWRILQGGPCKLQADHGQIMGRSWADQNDIKGSLYFKQHKSESVQRVEIFENVSF